MAALRHTPAPPGAPHVVRFAATERFALPPERLWAVLDDLEAYPRRWGWLHDFDADADTLRSGVTLRGVVAPPLAQRLRLRVVLREVVPAAWVAADVDGDLEGHAHLRLRRHTSTVTDVEVGWTVALARPTLRAAARMARPLLLWGHDRVVAATVSGLRRELTDTPRPAG